jgi:putative phage-type endonuclease
MIERPFIGGSDAAAVLGLDPYRTPVHVWLEKTGQAEPNVESEAATWGKRLEPLLAQAVEEHGYVTMPAPAETLRHHEHEFIVAHLDGYASTSAYEPFDPMGVLELKTAGFRSAAGWDDEQIPLAYQVQGAHYLAVTGLPFVIFGCLIAGQRFVVRRMERDEEVIGLLVEREAAFWQLVQDGTPPPPDGSQASTELLKRLHPASTGEIVTLDHLGGDLHDRYRQAQAARKSAELAEQEIENTVKDAMKNASVGTLGGAPAFTWKSMLTHRLDGKALKEEEPVVHARFYREVEQRRFVAVKR